MDKIHAVNTSENYYGSLYRSVCSRGASVFIKSIILSLYFLLSVNSYIVLISLLVHYHC